MGTRERRWIFGIECAEIWPRWWAGHAGQVAITASESARGWAVAVGDARTPGLVVAHAAGGTLAEVEAALDLRMRASILVIGDALDRRAAVEGAALAPAEAAS